MCIGYVFALQEIKVWSVCPPVPMLNVLQIGLY